MENLENKELETSDNLNEKIDELLEKKLADLVNKKIETKSAINFQSKDEDNVINTKDICRTALLDLRSKKLGSYSVNIVQKAHNETTNTAGGYVVETEKGDEIINIYNQFGLARQLCTIKPMTAYKRNFPKVGTGLVGYASVEGVALTGSQEVLSQVQLVTKDVSVITTSTKELLEDASYPFVEELFNSARTDIGKIEDQGMLVGWGNIWTGVAGASGIGTVTASATGAISSSSLSGTLGNTLRDMITVVQSANTNYDGVYVMHPSVLGDIEKLKNTQGDYIFNGYNPNALSPGTIFGKRVYITNVMPDDTNTASGTKMVIYGDFKQVFMGLRKDVVIESSDSAVINSESMFEKNMVAYKFLERVDFQVARANAFCALLLK